MSQGGSAPRPVSRRSSRSPARAVDTTSSSPLQRSHASRDDSGTRARREPGGIALTRGEARGQPAGATTLSARDILNPAGPRGVVSDQATTFQQHSATGQDLQSTTGAGQHGSGESPSLALAYQTPGATIPRPPNQAVPPTASPTEAAASADRGSPQAVHPYPMAARRILTPRSPRAASLTRAALRTVEAQHHATTANPPTSSPRRAISVYDPNAQTHTSGHPHLGAPSQFHGSVHGQGPTAPSATRPTSGLARSLSQPSLSHGLPSAPPLESLHPTGVKREHSGRPVLSGPPIPSPLPTNRAFSASDVLGDTRWGPGLLTSLPAGAARNLQISEGQPVLTITPRHGEEILVPVDVHQASRQADQKRQRNAGASQRFRQRKKEREREQQEELQKLDSENRELERRNEELRRRCQELEAEREFYRNERNRLRDIISQAGPSIKEWADRGPPSPISRTAGGTHAVPESGGLLAHQPPAAHAHSRSQPHSNQYHPPLSHPISHSHPRSSSYDDTSALEPPVRRRRTDSEPQLPTTSYNLMMPTTLPPITSAVPPHPPPPPVFGVPPSPHVTPPPSSSARLPPLRFDQSRTPSTTPPPVPSVVPPPAAMPPPQSGSPYTTSGKLPYETGWATDPRDSADSRQR